MNPQRLKEEIEEMTDFINFLKAEEAKAGAGVFRDFLRDTIKKETKEFYRLEKEYNLMNQQFFYAKAPITKADMAMYYGTPGSNGSDGSGPVGASFTFTPQTMVWNCEVCGAMNTDPNIKIISFPLKGGHGAIRNLKHCKDNPNDINSCYNKARSIAERERDDNPVQTYGDGISLFT